MLNVRFHAEARLRADSMETVVRSVLIPVLLISGFAPPLGKLLVGSPPPRWGDQCCVDENSACELDPKRSTIRLVGNRIGCLTVGTSQKGNDVLPSGSGFRSHQGESKESVTGRTRLQERRIEQPIPKSRCFCPRNRGRTPDEQHRHSDYHHPFHFIDRTFNGGSLSFAG